LREPLLSPTLCHVTSARALRLRLLQLLTLTRLLVLTLGLQLAGVMPLLTAGALSALRTDDDCPCCPASVGTAVDSASTSSVLSTGDESAPCSQCPGEGACGSCSAGCAHGQGSGTARTWVPTSGEFVLAVQLAWSHTLRGDGQRQHPKPDPTSLYRPPRATLPA
jgi:hypothetical protein